MSNEQKAEKLYTLAEVERLSKLAYQTGWNDCEALLGECIQRRPKNNARQYSAEKKNTLLLTKE